MEGTNVKVFKCYCVEPITLDIADILNMSKEELSLVYDSSENDGKLI